MGEITFINTQEGWLYLATLLDLFSRQVVGWVMADRMDASLVENAWKKTMIHRHPPVQLLHHTDRGSQYTSQA